MSQTALKTLLDGVIPGLTKRENPPSWPPDAFCVAAAVLMRTGAYTSAAMSWPPAKTPSAYADNIQQIGWEWRRIAVRGRVPVEVKRWWHTILGAKRMHAAGLPKHVSEALIQLLAAADEASAGLGMPKESWEEFDSFFFEADKCLIDSGGSTLCKEVGSHAGLVLPKMHTPQTGLTLRSFSLHLAFIQNKEIRPVWHQPPIPQFSSTFNILILPWPLKLAASNFRPVKAKLRLMRNLPNRYGFFEYLPSKDPTIVKRALSTFQNAAKKVPGNRIHAVVLPEASISDQQYDALNTQLFASSVHLIAGIAGKVDGISANSNCVRFNVPAVTDAAVSLRQSKHHRWRLDSSQIETYGLGLSKKKLWWEHISIKDRSLNFIALTSTLAISTLICEDLARPDPVGDLIRAVGPNLVLALLMDGPQLNSRWSGRYAAALADDPGCSVLTLSCLGMTELSKPPRKSDRAKYRRHVGLWKDPIGGAVSIEMRKGADAAVLTLEVEQRAEWTADGRTDGGVTGCPRLRQITFFKQGIQVATQNI